MISRKLVCYERLPLLVNDHTRGLVLQRGALILKNRNILIVLVILCIVTSSCFNYGRVTTQKLKLCYDGRYTGLDTLINLNGFYNMDVTFREDSRWDNQRVVFYNDGMMLDNPQLENISAFNLDLNKVGQHWNWGIYTLSNDTIIGQILYVDGATSACETFFYKIMDSCSIQRIHPQSRNNPMVDVVYDYRPLYYYKFSYSKANFIPYKTLPNPNVSKVKSKKWFWCDNEAYVTWKKQMKQTKKHKL